MTVLCEGVELWKFSLNSIIDKISFTPIFIFLWKKSLLLLLNIYISKNKSLVSSFSIYACIAFPIIINSNLVLICIF